MEKMELSEALKANASVLEGLIGTVSETQKGLMSSDMYKTCFISITVPANKVLKICEGKVACGYLCELIAYGVGALFAISTNNANGINSKAGLIGSTAIFPNTHYNFWRDDNFGVYVTSSSEFTLTILRAGRVNGIAMRVEDISTDSLTKLL